MPKLNMSLEIPKTGSPVPRLCSIHAVDGRGEYGDAGFRGNCSGLLIKDVLEFYEPSSCLDPMEGGGTCKDVCGELGIHYDGFDLSQGFDALERKSFTDAGIAYEFIWLHPPYHDLIEYNDDSRCLSRCFSYEEFLGRLQKVMENCVSVLGEEGKLAILVGEIVRKGECYQLPYQVERIASENLNLRLLPPGRISRLQHGATSTKKEYAHAFIPRIHDELMIFTK